MKGYQGPLLLALVVLGAAAALLAGRATLAYEAPVDALGLGQAVVTGSCEQHEFGDPGVQLYVYADGRSWHFTAQTDMVVNQVATTSVLASTGGTFQILIQINGETIASWVQAVNNPVYQPYLHEALVDRPLQIGDTITYFIFGGTMSDPAGGISGVNSVSLCAQASTGTIEVQSNQPEAGWQISGAATYSGTGSATLSEAPVGDYTIEWEPLAECTAPSQETLNLGEGGTITFNGAYLCGTTWTVTSAADAGPGTLRQLLLAASQGITITFDPAVFPPGGPATIAISGAALPAISQNHLVIDGQGAGVILDGSDQEPGPCLTISGDQNAVRGLQIVHCPGDGLQVVAGAAENTIQDNVIGNNAGAGVSISGSGAISNTISGNHLGVDPAGAAAWPNAVGVQIGGGASHNAISANLISGNETGIWLFGGDHNLVQGNIVGANEAGTAAIPNGQMGIFINQGAHDNLVGGLAPGDGNVIRGNGQQGVSVDGFASLANSLIGNAIFANGGPGIDLTNGGNGDLAAPLVATSDRANGAASGTACPNCLVEVFSDLAEEGRWFEGRTTADGQGQWSLATGQAFSGPVIKATATDGAGNSSAFSSSPIRWVTTPANAGPGSLRQHLLEAANGEIILFDPAVFPAANPVAIGLSGSPLPAINQDNLTISGSGAGVIIDGSALANGGCFQINGAGNVLANLQIAYCPADGVRLAPGAQGNLVSEAIIYANGANGVAIVGAAENEISGNLIGLDPSGKLALGNQLAGIYLAEGAQGNRLGGDSAAKRNVIAANGDAGVLISDLGTNNNGVIGNFIGLDISGLKAVANGNNGLIIQGQAAFNQIGGVTAAERNVISGNKNSGVWLHGEAHHNQVLGNYLGLAADGLTLLGNAWSGLDFKSGAHDNLAAGNWIAGNGDDGIYLDGAETLGNSLSQNSIYDNGLAGIELLNGSNGGLFPPMITHLTGQSVAGLTTPGATVEIFSDQAGQGRWFEGALAADGQGYFGPLQVPGGFTGLQVTATATDLQGNTSEFATPLAPKRDLVLAEIQRPRGSEALGLTLSPTLTILNQGTAAESFTVTVVITGPGDSLVYQQNLFGLELAAGHARALAFPAWTPDTAGSYEAAAWLSLVAPDDAPGNDWLAQAFEVTADWGDLWARDNERDDGREPSPGWPWTSPDLWVRQAADGQSEHQSPLNGQPNAIYGQVRNRGTAALNGATVSFYWHPPSLVIGRDWWQWIATEPLPEVAPGGLIQVTVPWQPEVPGLATGKAYHASLRLEIDGSGDPTPAFSSVRGSNNISQRNVAILTPPTSPGPVRASLATPVTTTFMVANPYGVATLVDLTLTVTLPGGSAAELDLGELLARWQSLGLGELTGAELISGTNRIALKNGEVQLTGIPLAAKELVEVELSLAGLIGLEGAISVSENLAGEALGGLTFVIVGVPEQRIYLPLVMR